MTKLPETIGISGPAELTTRPPALMATRSSTRAVVPRRRLYAAFVALSLTCAACGNAPDKTTTNTQGGSARAPGAPPSK